MVGNKCDCNAIRQVSSDKASAWARSNGVRPYEVTVMNRDCLKEPFCYIAWRMANPGNLDKAEEVGHISNTLGNGSFKTATVLAPMKKCWLGIKKC